ncbi:MAG: gliding motility-associated C-terminal domain-containing protein [Bacteroidetes bacterium]|nr:gliding motility-associated C-terminal domain-containing protein [Bacteroidota bacterium]MBP9548263.1 gliding motility-associated C-terminal domain-containing protein [Chitinophagales bacterium]
MQNISKIYKQSKNGIAIIIVFLLNALHVSAQSTIPVDLLCAYNEIDGDVVIVWSPTIEACGSFVEYNIYASNTLTGPYTLLTTIPTYSSFFYTHVGADGTITTWYYYIEAVYDCPGYTITLSDTLDNLDPIAPEIDYVTVVTGVNVQINWFPSPSPETTSYIIYRDIGGFTPIDTVYGRFTTTYTDYLALPAAQVETYTIAARDSCGNVGPFNNNSHHTILLTNEWEVCTDSIYLYWNLYDTWTPGVSAYEVLLDDDGSGAVTVATLPPITTSYIYSGPEFDDGYIYAFIIRALRADGTAISESNTRGFIIENYQPVSYYHIRNATVNENNDIFTQFYPDTDGNIENLSVQRSTDNLSYLTISVATFPGGVPFTYNYTDFSPDPSANSYYYQSFVNDACNNQVYSGYARTILLRGNNQPDFTNDIDWNLFEISNGIVLHYNLYRDDGAGMNLISTFTPDQISYTDNVVDFLNEAEQICYQMEAVYQLDLPDINISEQLSSFSNTLCLELSPRIYVPNAIAPDGVNNFFKPVILNGMEDTYSMQIFDRYGKILFETTDIDIGWDGKFNGKTMQVGTYAYVITFTATNGQAVIKKGNVTVVK